MVIYRKIAMICYHYNTFGEQLEAIEQFRNRIRYAGQQYDNLTGQYYLSARYYNLVLGRFMEDVYWGDGLIRNGCRFW